MPPKRKTAAAKANKATPPAKKTKGRNTEETPEHSESENAAQDKSPHGDDSNFEESEEDSDSSFDDSFYDSLCDPDTYDEFYAHSLEIFEQNCEEYPPDAQIPEELCYLNLQMMTESGVLEMEEYADLKEEWIQINKERKDKND